MNTEEIDKWLDNEYGVSYTRLEELHDFYFEKYCDLKEENQELKKQLEEWEHHLKCSKEILDIQGQNGNYNYDSYMLGLYNGIEYIISLFETREPIFRSGKDIEFLSDKTQQKEFILYLENEKDRLIHETSHYYTDSFDRQHAVNEDMYDEVDKISIKFKEIIRGKDE